ncbi:hypothetical protein [Ruegeria sp.]|uniref:hypothetical protein n=1 Tax=Ruegeria sp. TaxID=1879320 RepID=UPI003C7CEDE3
MAQIFSDCYGIKIAAATLAGLIAKKAEQMSDGCAREAVQVFGAGILDSGQSRPCAFGSIPRAQ